MVWLSGRSRSVRGWGGREAGVKSKLGKVEGAGIYASERGVVKSS